ncbi:methyl-accepting chemotaxis protein [Methylophaga sp.]|uniref:methyl-accepting chemotaxis protein n=1 Tax=Methylophaga sp. TaxID=2024840 RepID=UPI0013FF9E5F|nr:methyl-accepting chemotaxis protein [Methylophaga sp.]MTI64172.1 methyl-accepting chemotaxis protein [Methylophaga sp.]
MKLSLVSRFITFSIVGLLILSALTAVWGWRQLDKPYQIADEFQQYRNTFDIDVRILLERYLASGQADLLQQAEDKLNVLAEQSFNWLNEAENQQIHEAINQLQSSVQAVRAAGKLAANPQTLLINNERERAGDIGMLISYADQADYQFNAEQTVFLSTLAEMGRSLNQLSHQRQAFFEEQGEARQKALLAQNQKFAELAAKLESMPRFGIYTEKDEMSLIPQEPDEIGEVSIASVQSLTRRYDKEIANTISFMQQVDQGRASLNQHILSLQSTLNSFQQQIADIKASITNQVRWAMLAAVVLIVIAVSLQAFIQKLTLASLLELESFFRGMQKGDFSQTLELDSRFEETRSAADSASHLQTYLAELIAKLQAQAQHVTSASQSLQSVSASTSELSRQQHNATDQVATAVTELSYSFKEVADNAIQASKSASEANQATQTARHTLSEATEASEKLAADLMDVEKVMNKLEQNGNNIRAVLEVIQGVAEQTNLLALNAAIEAARAGEHGRGFAVVADEVRQLASRTTQSTEEIRSIIVQLTDSGSEATAIVSRQSLAAADCARQTAQARSAMEPVVSAIKTINEINAAIASATQEQTTTVDEIARTTEQIKLDSQQVDQYVGDINHAGEDMTRISYTLEQLVRQLKQAD